MRRFFSMKVLIEEEKPLTDVTEGVVKPRPPSLKGRKTCCHCAGERGAEWKMERKTFLKETSKDWHAEDISSGVQVRKRKEKKDEKT